MRDQASGTRRTCLSQYKWRLWAAIDTRKSTFKSQHVQPLDLADLIMWEDGKSFLHAFLFFSVFFLYFTSSRMPGMLTELGGGG